MENKEVRITIRCTQKQKELIERKAKRANLSVSSYMVNKALQKKTNPYKTFGDKQKIQALISMKESFNNIERLKQYEYIGPAVSKELTNIMSQEENVWRFL